MEYYCSYAGKQKNRIVGGYCEWVIMLEVGNVNSYYSLWNSITKETIKLPPVRLTHYQKIDYCLMTDSPSDKDTKILLFGSDFPSIMCCELGDNKNWTEIWYRDQVRSLSDYCVFYLLREPINCNGNIYAISYHYRDLLLLELDGSDSLSVSLLTNLPVQPHMHCPNFRGNLVESLGEIFYIWINMGGKRDREVISVGVFKLDFLTMTWAKVTSAKDRVFFLERSYNMSCPSKVEGSRIYFTIRGDKSVYRYNIEDQSILAFLPCRNPATPHSRRSDWRKPDLSLVNKEEPPKENDVVTTVEKVGKINLQDLPSLVLNSIARNLTLFDYMNFRVLGKEFCSAAPLDHWKTEFAGLESNQLLLSPWLIYPENSKGIYNLVDSRLNNRCFLTIPDSLQNFTIRCSKDGWLLMSKGFRVALFNPFTKVTIQLPHIRRFFGDKSFILTASPSSPDCRIVGVSPTHTLDVFISIIHPGDKEWVYFQPFVWNSVRRIYDSAVFCRGLFYFLDDYGMFKVLNIQDGEELAWQSLYRVAPPCTSFYQNYLAECDGELLAIFVGEMGESVQVFKLNFTKLVWEKVTSLNNYALYLNRSSQLSTTVKSPEMANRIYFPRFHKQGMVFYSLDTGKFHALGSEKTLKNSYYNTTAQLNCGWIESSWC